MLIVLGGLPGTGKTTLARAICRRLGAVHLRIDTIESALSQSSAVSGPVGDAGYRVAYALAADNLNLGAIVVADSVNPISLTRKAWRDVAASAGAPALEVEAVCSDASEHRRRVETRTADIAGHVLPTWSEVLARDYEPWPAGILVIDTATQGLDDSVATVVAAARAIDGDLARPPRAPLG